MAPCQELGDETESPGHVICEQRVGIQYSWLLEDVRAANARFKIVTKMQKVG